MTKDCKEVFTEIYRTKKWGDGSGGGSVPATAKPYVDFVSQYLRELQLDKPDWALRWVLDLGTGDGVVAGMIDLGRWNMYCEDVVSGFDALTHELPQADLVLCKEVLQHLSNEQVQLLLDRTAHYKRRLFTNSNFTDGKPVNCDIDTGDFRAVDLSLPPFNQPCKTVFTYGTWIVQEL